MREEIHSIGIEPQQVQDLRIFSSEYIFAHHQSYRIGGCGGKLIYVSASWELNCRAGGDHLISIMLGGNLWWGGVFHLFVRNPYVNIVGFD